MKWGGRVWVGFPLGWSAYAFSSILTRTGVAELPCRSVLGWGRAHTHTHTHTHRVISKTENPGKSLIPLQVVKMAAKALPRVLFHRILFMLAVLIWVQGSPPSHPLQMLSPLRVNTL